MTCTPTPIQGSKKELNSTTNTYAPKNAHSKKPASHAACPSVPKPAREKQYSRRANAYDRWRNGSNCTNCARAVVEEAVASGKPPSCKARNVR